MKKKFPILLVAVSLLVAGVFAGYAVPGEATVNASSEGVWNEFVELGVEFEVNFDDGVDEFFEISYEESGDGEDGTERILEVCFPLVEGFNCEEVELDELDVSVEFGFPREESTASVEAEIPGCGEVSFDIVIPLGLGRETLRSMKFGPDNNVVAISTGVEITSEGITVDEGLEAVICDEELTSENVAEASASMIREEVREREEEE